MDCLLNKAALVLKIGRDSSGNSIVRFNETVFGGPIKTEAECFELIALDDGMLELELGNKARHGVAVSLLVDCAPKGISNLSLRLSMREQVLTAYSCSNSGSIGGGALKQGLFVDEDSMLFKVCPTI